MTTMTTTESPASTIQRESQVGPNAMSLSTPIKSSSSGGRVPMTLFERRPTRTSYTSITLNGFSVPIVCLCLLPLLISMVCIAWGTPMTAATALHKIHNKIALRSPSAARAAAPLSSQASQTTGKNVRSLLPTARGPVNVASPSIVQSSSSGINKHSSGTKSSSSVVMSKAIDEAEMASAGSSHVYVPVPLAEPPSHNSANSLNVGGINPAGQNGHQQWPKKFQIGYIKQSDLHQVLIESLKQDKFIRGRHPLSSLESLGQQMKWQSAGQQQQQQNHQVRSGPQRKQAQQSGYAVSLAEPPSSLHRYQYLTSDSMSSSSSLPQIRSKTSSSSGAGWRPVLDNVDSSLANDEQQQQQSNDAGDDDRPGSMAMPVAIASIGQDRDNSQQIGKIGSRGFVAPASLTPSQISPAMNYRWRTTQASSSKTNSMTPIVQQQQQTNIDAMVGFDSPVNDEMPTADGDQRQLNDTIAAVGGGRKQPSSVGVNRFDSNSNATTPATPTSTIVTTTAAGIAPVTNNASISGETTTSAFEMVTTTTADSSATDDSEVATSGPMTSTTTESQTESEGTTESGVGATEATETSTAAGESTMAPTSITTATSGESTSDQSVMAAAGERKGDSATSTTQASVDSSSKTTTPATITTTSTSTTTTADDSDIITSGEFDSDDPEPNVSMSGATNGRLLQAQVLSSGKKTSRSRNESQQEMILGLMDQQQQRQQFEDWGDMEPAGITMRRPQSSRQRALLSTKAVETTFDQRKLTTQSQKSPVIMAMAMSKSLSNGNSNNNETSEQVRQARRLSTSNTGSNRAEKLKLAGDVKTSVAAKAKQQSADSASFGLKKGAIKKTDAKLSSTNAGSVKLSTNVAISGQQQKTFNATVSNGQSLVKSTSKLSKTKSNGNTKRSSRQASNLQPLTPALVFDLMMAALKAPSSSTSPASSSSISSSSSPSVSATNRLLDLLMASNSCTSSGSCLDFCSTRTLNFTRSINTNTDTANQTATNFIRSNELSKRQTMSERLTSGISTTEATTTTSSSSSSSTSTTPAWSVPTIVSNEIMSLARRLDADLALKMFTQWKDAIGNTLDFNASFGYTFVLPSNEAIRRLPASSVDEWQRNHDLMARIIDNHIIDSVEAINITSASHSAPLHRMVRSKNMQINRIRDKVATINGKRVVFANQEAPSGGLIHVIDGIMDSPKTQAKDIMETLRQCDKFDGFVTLAEGTGLSDTLTQDGPFTVFVPSNEALRKIPDDELDVIKNNSTALKEFLMYHVVNGSYFSQDLRDGQQLATLFDNRPLQVGVRVDGCSRRLVEANTSPMKKPDIVVKNGVIHILDWYLSIRDTEWCDPIASSRLVQAN